MRFINKFNLLNDRVVNLILRSASGAFKFLFHILLITILDFNNYSFYALSVSFVNIILVVLGLEYYSFSTRLIASENRKKIGAFLGNQLFIALFMTIIFIPLIFLYAKYILLFKVSFISLMFFLMTEQVLREIMRLLTSLNKQLSSTFVQLFYTVLPLLLCFVFYLFKVNTSVNYIFIFLCITNFIIIIGSLYIYRNYFFPLSFNFLLLKHGLKISWKYIFIGFGNKLTISGDKLILAKLISPELLGAYSFIMTIGNFLNMTIESLIVSFANPKLARISHLNNTRKFDNVFNRYLKEMILIIFITSLLFVIVWIMDLKSFRTVLDSNFILLFAILFLALNSLNMLYQSKLYSNKYDNTILWSILPFYLIFLLNPILTNFGVDSRILITLLAFSILNFLSLTIKLYLPNVLRKFL